MQHSAMFEKRDATKWHSGISTRGAFTRRMHRSRLYFTAEESIIGLLSGQVTATCAAIMTHISFPFPS